MRCFTRLFTLLFTVLFTLLLGLLLSCVPVSAQSKYPVRMRMEPLSIRGRSGGPIPLRIKLEYNSPQLLEGDLVLEIYNTIYTPTDLAATIRYEGIVLQGSDYFFDTVLPPIEHSVGKQYEITAWFETEAGRIPLSTDLKNPNEPTELLSIGPHQRATVICSCTGDSIAREASANRRFLNQALSLDNYNPVPPESENGRLRPEDQSVLNYAASWDALDLPENPMHLCSFDIVLLADGALSRLDSGQLAALTTWCEAGGSVCILPDDRNLNGIHLQFLQTLFERDFDPSVHLSLTDDGELLVISDQDDAIVNRQFGLGRVTLLPNSEDLAGRLTAEELGGIVGHLWKARRDSEIFTSDTWHVKHLQDRLDRAGIHVVKKNGVFYVSGQNYRGQVNPGFVSLDEIASLYGIGGELSPQRSTLTNACENSLMPKGVSMVPTSVIALLLVAYVITIGPVDYFLLGYLRIRKYTWILFPFVTAAFTALTIFIAHQYMASSETGGRLTIVDVVDDGRPVRQSEIRMHFYGEQKDYQEELKNTFSISAQMIIGSDDPLSSPKTSGPSMTKMQYAGRFPQSSTTTLQLRQWEPQMTRSMTLIPTESDVPKIPWDNFSLVASKSGRDELRSKLSLLQQSGTEVDAIVINRQSEFPLFPSRGFLFPHSAISISRSLPARQPWQPRVPIMQDAVMLTLGILDASVRTEALDFFSIVSQVAPHGAASLEDLPILDDSDSNQWLLIVAVKNQQHTRIFRRLFLQDEEQAHASSHSLPE